MLFFVLEGFKARHASSLGWYEKADAPKHKKSELQSLFFPLELLCPCGAVRAREKVCRASALRVQSPQRVWRVGRKNFLQ